MDGIVILARYKFHLTRVHQLPHTGGDAVHDTQTPGPTTQDNQGEPSVSFSVQTLGVLG